MKCELPKTQIGNSKINFSNDLKEMKTRKSNSEAINFRFSSKDAIAVFLQVLRYLRPSISVEKSKSIFQPLEAALEK